MATETTITAQETMTEAEFLDMLHECFVDEIHDAKSILGMQSSQRNITAIMMQKF